MSLLRKEDDSAGLSDKSAEVDRLAVRVDLIKDRTETRLGGSLDGLEEEVDDMMLWEAFSSCFLVAPSSVSIRACVMLGQMLAHVQ